MTDTRTGLTPAELVEVAFAAAEIIKATKAIPLDDLEQYACHARTYAGHREAITPILGLEMGANAIRREHSMNQHVAEVAEALVNLRRVIGDVDG